MTLLGDLLASKVASKNVAHPDTILLPSGVAPTGSAIKVGYLPGRLVQKITIIEDVVALAYCGPINHIPKVVQELKRSLSEGGAWVNNITTRLSKMPRKWTKGAGIIILVSQPDGALATIRFGDIGILEGSGYQSVWAAGSGRNHFFEVFHRICQPVDPDWTHQSSLAVASGLVAALADIEIAHKASTPMLYGGSYELCYWTGERILKLDDYVISKLRIELFDNEYELSLINVTHHRYEDEDLLITSIIPRNGGNTVFTTYARNPTRWHLSERPPHAPMFNGSNYIISTEVLWNGAEVGDNTVIEYGVGAEVRPFNVIPSSDGASAAIIHREDWLLSLVNAAKAAALEKFPHATFT